MNIGRFLSSTAAHHPNHLATRWGSKNLNYKQLNNRVNRLCEALSSLGVGRGDRISLLLWNRPELLEVMFASFKLGACVVPLNARLSTDEISYHVNDSGSRVLVTSSEFDQTLSSFDADDLEHLISVDATDLSMPNLGMHRYEELLLNHAGSRDEWVDVPPDHVCWLFYTSGTTGQPKGAMLTHANLLFVTLGWIADVVPLSSQDVTLHAAALTHGAGFHALAATAKGAAQLIPEERSFNAEGILRLIEQEDVTNTWLVPTQIRRLMDAESLSERNLSSLHSIAYGGAPFHVDDLEEAIAKLGSILVQIYGQGESPMTGTCLPRHEHTLTTPLARRRLASAGYSRTGIDVRIVDTHESEIGAGETGEILIRGPSVMTGYLNQPEATEETLRGGWLHTGDLGMLDDNGYLYVQDRLKDMVISGGSNVYAREVEDVILRHPEVKAAAIVGLPDRDWGERVVAVVVPHPGCTVTPEDIIFHCGRSLASYKKPKQVVFVQELPLSPYGKVLKRELRQQIMMADGRDTPPLRTT